MLARGIAFDRVQIDEGQPLPLLALEAELHYLDAILPLARSLFGSWINAIVRPVVADQMR